MTFINSYKPATIDASTKEPYDVNSNLPIPPFLETERVKLVPFLPSTHAIPFYAIYHANPSLARYLPMLMELPTIDDFYLVLNGYIQPDPTSVLFAIIDKTKPNYDTDLAASLAGIIGLIKCAPSQLAVEIGPVIILPAFQRSFVSSNAVGLLLRYILDTPKDGGLGFRRVNWTANPLNVASIRAAERLGFKQEGVMRWTWALGPDKEGTPVPEERGGGKGRDSVLMAICWDDWEARVKDLITKQIDRV